MITRKLKIMAVVLIIGTIAGSCKKGLLDVFPSDALSDATVFEDINVANRFLTNIYGTMPNGFARRDQNPGDAGWSRGMSAFAMATDDAEANNLASSTHGLNGGTLPTTWAYADDIWVQNYAVIRKANSFMEKIDDVPGEESLKKRMKAEAKFLRAFAYGELVKCFGGVPLMLTAGTPEEAIIPRNSYEECVNQIVKDCDEAAADLPAVMPVSDLGRATKVAAACAGVCAAIRIDPVANATASAPVATIDRRPANRDSFEMDREQGRAKRRCSMLVIAAPTIQFELLIRSSIP